MWICYVRLLFVLWKNCEKCAFMTYRIISATRENSKQLSDERTRNKMDLPVQDWGGTAISVQLERFSSHPGGGSARPRFESEEHARFAMRWGWDSAGGSCFRCRSSSHPRCRTTRSRPGDKLGRIHWILLKLKMAASGWPIGWGFQEHHDVVRKSPGD